MMSRFGLSSHKVLALLAVVTLLVAPPLAAEEEDWGGGSSQTNVQGRVSAAATLDALKKNADADAASAIEAAFLKEMGYEKSVADTYMQLAMGVRYFKPVQALRLGLQACRAPKKHSQTYQCQKNLIDFVDDVDLRVARSQCHSAHEAYDGVTGCIEGALKKKIAELSRYNARKFIDALLAQASQDHANEMYKSFLRSMEIKYTIAEIYRDGKHVSDRIVVSAEDEKRLQAMTVDGELLMQAHARDLCKKATQSSEHAACLDRAVVFFDATTLNDAVLDCTKSKDAVQERVTCLDTKLRNGKVD